MIVLVVGKHNDDDNDERHYHDEWHYQFLPEMVLSPRPSSNARSKFRVALNPYNDNDDYDDDNGDADTDDDDDSVPSNLVLLS